MRAHKHFRKRIDPALVEPHAIRYVLRLAIPPASPFADALEIDALEAVSRAHDQTCAWFSFSSPFHSFQPKRTENLRLAISEASDPLRLCGRTRG